MDDAALRVLWVDTPGMSAVPAAAWAGLDVADAFGPFSLTSEVSLDAALLRLGGRDIDVVVLAAPSADEDIPKFWTQVGHLALQAAVVMVAVSPTRQLADHVVALGVQDLLAAEDLTAQGLARALFMASERKQLDMDVRRAYSTDLGTGLPNHAQLLEHMSHLLALREREPVPMALIVMRVEGLISAEADLGPEAVNVLRRKIAVRLRAGVRASDVVASLGASSFALLLSAMEEPGHGARVVEKLLASLHRPFHIAGLDVSVAAGAGIATYPADGKTPDALFLRASAAAAVNPAVGRFGVAGGAARHGMAVAANDE